jgi:hypothetical protein
MLLIARRGINSVGMESHGTAFILITQKHCDLLLLAFPQTEHPNRVSGRSWFRISSGTSVFL